MSRYPERIVCLTEETTETLYLLGEGHRVVGIPGYTLRPPEAREKPNVSAFISAQFDKIPNVILASWCGKRVRKATILERKGWNQVRAVQRGQIHEIASTYILQPGPASLTEGVR